MGSPDLGAAAVTSSSRLRTALAGALLAAGVLTTGAVAAGATTTATTAATTAPAGTEATAGAGPSRAAEAERDQRKADRRADRDQRRADRAAEQDQRKADRPRAGAAGEGARTARVTGPAFVCDPALSHGQNVSAYARSLPKGPGRGRLVSQAARSDCGKPAGDD
jgi:hypothetical protein